ncbi:MAG TPA: ABC transporter substrate-binding protein [Acetobacteraceae bacterium]
MADPTDIGIEPPRPHALTRRTALLGAATAGLLATHPAQAQSDPIRLGFLTVKTGPLAAGGIQMEQGLALYLKDRGNQLAGRPVQLFTADTGGTPANTRTKTQELVERNNVSAIIGPLAAFELLAIDGYMRDKQIPWIGVAAAEDVTQRNPNPWFVRVSASSAQCTQPMADYAAKELKYKRMATVGDDFAYGQEQNAGFQRVFEDEGGKIVQKIWPPLNAPDYGTFVAQFKPDLDGIFMSFAGSNGFRFFKQFKEYGGSTPILGGMTAVDEAILQQMGDDAVGMLSACWYSAQLDTPLNRTFVQGMQRDYKVDPGYYAAGTYVAAAVLEGALKSINGKVEDKAALMHALRAGTFDTARGPVRFDDYGNVIGNVYIRKVERKSGRLVNTVIKTYPDVSQFWTYDPASFLKQPVYARDTPPARNLEN